jgi:hypothetical protein
MSNACGSQNKVSFNSILPALLFTLSTMYYLSFGKATGITIDYKAGFLRLSSGL